MNRERTVVRLSVGLSVAAAGCGQQSSTWPAGTGPAVLAASHVLHMLKIPIRLGRHDSVPGLVNRGHRALDELKAIR